MTVIEHLMRRDPRITHRLYRRIDRDYWGRARDVLRVFRDATIWPAIDPSPVTFWTLNGEDCVVYQFPREGALPGAPKKIAPRVAEQMEMFQQPRRR
jgi:hypothetical protein